VLAGRQVALILFFTAWGLFVLPSGPRPSRSVGASSAALRPACACDRAGRPAVGPLAVLLPRRDPRSEASTPHRGTPARDPHAPAKSAFARWAVLAAHPPGELSSCCTRSASPNLSASAAPPSGGWGAFHPPLGWSGHRSGGRGAPARASPPGDAGP